VNTKGYGCSQFENNCFTEMCSGSEAGSYLRFIDFVYHSTLGLRVIKKRKKRYEPQDEPASVKRQSSKVDPLKSGGRRARLGCGTPQKSMFAKVNVRTC